MAQELELSECTTIYEFKGLSGTEKNTSRNTEQSERRLFRTVILTLGALCIIQAALNISLRLALYSKEDTEQFPFNSSVIADLCQNDQSHQNSSHLCSCCNNLLRRLWKQYQDVETERDFLQDKVSQLSKATTITTDDFQDTGSAGSGFGYLEN